MEKERVKLIMLKAVLDTIEDGENVGGWLDIHLENMKKHALPESSYWFNRDVRRYFLNRQRAIQLGIDTTEYDERAREIITSRSPRLT